MLPFKIHSTFTPNYWLYKIWLNVFCPHTWNILITNNAILHLSQNELLRPFQIFLLIFQLCGEDVFNDFFSFSIQISVP